MRFFPVKKRMKPTKREPVATQAEARQLSKQLAAPRARHRRHPKLGSWGDVWAHLRLALEGRRACDKRGRIAPRSRDRVTAGPGSG